MISSNVRCVPSVGFLIAMRYAHFNLVPKELIRSKYKMYVPKHFQTDDFSAIKEVMHQNDFALVVSLDQATPIATHLLVNADLFSR